MEVELRVDLHLLLVVFPVPPHLLLSSHFKELGSRHHLWVLLEVLDEALVVAAQPRQQQEVSEFFSIEFGVVPLLLEVRVDDFAAHGSAFCMFSKVCSLHLF